MTTVDLGSLTDAIPLLDDNGSGSYIKGRNDIRDIRVELFGALFAQVNSSMVARVGVLPLAFDGTNFVNKMVVAQGTPNQQITVNSGRSIITRTNQGPYLVTLETGLTVTLPNADSTNPRWDVIYEIPYDKGVGALGDTLHGPHLICETGTPGSSPVVPSIPSDANKLAEVFRRTSGASPSGNIIQSADIVDKRKSTSLMGAPRYLLPGDALGDAGGYHGEVRVRVGTNFVDTAIAATGTKILRDQYDAISGVWRGLIPSIKLSTGSMAAQNHIVHFEVRTIGTLAIPDPGYPYRLRLTSSFDAVQQVDTGLVFQFRTGSTSGPILFTPNTSLQGYYLSRSGDASSGAADNNRNIAPVGCSAVLTGANTVYILAIGLHSNTGGWCDVSANAFADFEIVPV